MEDSRGEGGIDCGNVREDECPLTPLAWKLVQSFNIQCHPFFLLGHYILSSFL